MVLFPLYLEDYEFAMEVVLTKANQNTIFILVAKFFLES